MSPRTPLGCGCCLRLLVAAVRKRSKLGRVPSFEKRTQLNRALPTQKSAGSRCSWFYPNSTYSERAEIHQQHVDYQQGFLWTLANDPAIPKPVQDRLNTFGLCKDEFVS